MIQNNFEMILVTDGALTTEENETVVTKFKEIITKSGGTVADTASWGRRKLAYEMNKKKHGIYTLIYCTASGATIDEIQLQTGYDDQVLKAYVVSVKDLAQAKQSFEELLAEPKKTSKLITEVGG